METGPGPNPSIYEKLYVRLRPALHQLSIHGTRVDVDGMAKLADEWKARTKVIKEELDGLTNGVPLYAVDDVLSQAARDANVVRFNLLMEWKSRPKGRDAAKSEYVTDLKQRIEVARANIEELKQAGRYHVRVVGDGLSDKRIKAYLSSQGIKLPTKRNKDTGGTSETADDVALKRIALEKPAFRDLVRLILEHRKCVKMASTYCNLEKVDDDSRIRCSWKPCGTQTGRLSSSENPLGGGLNQQNIPDHDDYGFKVKRLYLPDEGCVFLKFDLSMAEARNFFWRTGDKALKEIASSKPWEVDVYKDIAAAILTKIRGTPVLPGDVTKEERQTLGKKVGLSSNYGVAGATLSKAFVKDGYYYAEKECAEFISGFHAAFPGVRKHHQVVIARAIQQRTNGGIIKLRNSFGREIEFAHERLDIPLYHRLFAWPSQSDIGDHNNQLGLVPFWHNRNSRGWKSMANAVVHDENLISAYPEEAWAIACFMKESLETPYEVGGQGKLSIPVTVSLGPNWQDVEEFKQLEKDKFMATLENLCRQMGL